MQLEQQPPPSPKLKSESSAKPSSPPPASARPLENREHKSHWLTWVIVVFCLLIVVAIFLGMRKRAAEKAAASKNFQPVVPVLAQTVKEKNVPSYLDGLGTVQAFYTVTVHVRVDGQIKKLNFIEGQDVKAGDALAQIDPDPFQTALDQAVAKKGQDEALLGNAQLDLKREVALYAAKVDSQQVYDTQKALVNQYVAAVKADQAAIDSAQVQLNYTTISSPIDGRTGIRQMDPGNIAHANDTNGLVVITQLKPISVMFTLPEQNLREIHQRMAADTNQLEVLAIGRDNKTILDKGTLAVIDNQIDTTTGTLRIKATFPNEKLNLWPGEFLNVRLQIGTRTNGLVVPAAAIQRGPNGAYVFIINTNIAADTNISANGKSSSGKGKPAYSGSSAVAKAPAGAEKKAGGKGGAPGTDRNNSDNPPSGTVSIRTVTVSPQIEAGEALVNTGLKLGDLVVTDGQYKLQDGSTVKIQPPSKANTVDSTSADSIQ